VALVYCGHFYRFDSPYPIALRQQIFRYFCQFTAHLRGLPNLQLPSLIATICFMIGGILMIGFGLPLILSL
jgi:hypothetical protein